MNGAKAAAPMLLTGARPNSGTADPNEPTRNSSAATIRPALRPSRLAIGPPARAPIMQPSNAQDIAQPERQTQAATRRPHKQKKKKSMAGTAPEMTAVS